MANIPATTHQNHKQEDDGNISDDGCSITSVQYRKNEEIMKRIKENEMIEQLLESDSTGSMDMDLDTNDEVLDNILGKQTPAAEMEKSGYEEGELTDKEEEYAEQRKKMAENTATAPRSFFSGQSDPKKSFQYNMYKAKSNGPIDFGGGMDLSLYSNSSANTSGASNAAANSTTAKNNNSPATPVMPAAVAIKVIGQQKQQQNWLKQQLQKPYIRISDKHSQGQLADQNQNRRPPQQTGPRRESVATNGIGGGGTQPVPNRIANVNRKDPLGLNDIGPKTPPNSPPPDTPKSTPRFQLGSSQENVAERTGQNSSMERPPKNHRQPQKQNEFANEKMPENLETNAHPHIDGRGRSIGNGGKKRIEASETPSPRNNSTATTIDFDELGRRLDDDLRNLKEEDERQSMERRRMKQQQKLVVSTSGGMADNSVQNGHNSMADNQQPLLNIHRNHFDHPPPLHDRHFASKPIPDHSQCKRQRLMEEEEDVEEEVEMEENGRHQYNHNNSNANRNMGVDYSYHTNARRGRERERERPMEKRRRSRSLAPAPREADKEEEEEVEMEAANGRQQYNHKSSSNRNMGVDYTYHNARREREREKPIENRRRNLAPREADKEEEEEMETANGRQHYNSSRSTARRNVGVDYSYPHTRREMRRESRSRERKLAPKVAEEVETTNGRQYFNNKQNSSTTRRNVGVDYSYHRERRESPIESRKRKLAPKEAEDVQRETANNRQHYKRDSSTRRNMGVGMESDNFYYPRPEKPVQNHGRNQVQKEGEEENVPVNNDEDAQNKNGWLYYDHCAKQRPAEKPAKICVSGFGADVDIDRLYNYFGQFGSMVGFQFSKVPIPHVLINYQKWTEAKSALGQNRNRIAQGIKLICEWSQYQEIKVECGTQIGKTKDTNKVQGKEFKPRSILKKYATPAAKH